MTGSWQICLHIEQCPCCSSCHSELDLHISLASQGLHLTELIWMREENREHGPQEAKPSRDIDQRVHDARSIQESLTVEGLIWPSRVRHVVCHSGFLRGFPFNTYCFFCS